MKLPYRRTLYAIVGFGLFLKLLSLAFIFGHLQLYGQQVGDWDSPTYFNPAMTLAHRFTFHSEVRTPGYPAFLALIYALTRDPNPISNLNMTVIFVIQAVILSLGCFPVASAIKRLTGNERLALLGAFVWAINNSARYYSLLILTEALAATMMCLFAYTLVRAVKERRTIWLGATGLLMFLLTLVRPSISLLAVPVTVGYLTYTVLLCKDRSAKGIVLVLALLLLLPMSSQWLWSYRNYRLEGKWYYCRLSTSGVYAFGVAIPVGLSEGIPPEQTHMNVWYEYFRLLNVMSPQDMDRMYMNRVREAIRTHPVPIAKYFLKSCVFLFIPTINKPLDPKIRYRDMFKPSFYLHLPSGERAKYLFYITNSLIELVCIMGIMALILSRSLPKRLPTDPTRRGYFILVLLMLAYWIPIHATSAQYAFTRLLFPLMPVLIVGAALALAERQDNTATEAALHSTDLPVSSPVVS
jgi:hypothetical protein